MFGGDKTWCLSSLDLALKSDTSAEGWVLFHTLYEPSAGTAVDFHRGYLYLSLLGCILHD